MTVDPKGEPKYWFCLHPYWPCGSESCLDGRTIHVQFWKDNHRCTCSISATDSRISCAVTMQSMLTCWTTCMLTINNNAYPFSGWQVFTSNSKTYKGDYCVQQKIVWLLSWSDHCNKFYQLWNLHKNGIMYCIKLILTWNQHAVVTIVWGIYLYTVVQPQDWT